MKVYNVVFAYSIEVEAEDEDEAEEKGVLMFTEDQPNIRDFGCIVEEKR